MQKSVICKPGKEKVIFSRNSWLYTGAIQKRVNAQKGDIVEIFLSSGKLAGYGFYFGGQNIEVYIFDFTETPQDVHSEKYWYEKINNAWQFRQKHIINHTKAFRLIHSEGDGIPGLTIDIYNNVAVIDFKILGTEKIAHHIFSSLKKLGINNIYVNSSVTGNYNKTVVAGKVPDKIEINENGILFYVDIKNGQKTGFFLDQRDNRLLLTQYSQGANVLNLFSYTGGFSLYALKGGAKQVWSVDISKEALKTAEENITLNNLNANKHIIIPENAFDILNRLEYGIYDLIILDPPAFAKKDKDIPQAVKAYKTINYQAIKNIKQGGILFTFSCSQKIDKTLFRKIIFSAASKAQRKVSILHQLHQSPDHPIDIYQPQSEYLKGFVLKID